MFRFQQKNFCMIDEINHYKSQFLNIMTPNQLIFFQPHAMCKALDSNNFLKSLMNAHLVAGVVTNKMTG